MRVISLFIKIYVRSWALLAVCCAAGPLLMPGSARAADVGQIITLTPGAFVERGGTRSPLALNSPVQETDTITTDATGRVRILFEDDGAVTLGPNTSLALVEVLPGGAAPVFKAHVAQGVARFITGRIVERNPKGFAVSTPEGVAGIRGTIFVLQTGQGRTTLYVVNATRDVVLNGVSVPGGFKMTLPGGSPVPMTPEDFSVTQTLARVPASSEANPQLAENDPLTPSALADLALATQNTGDTLTLPATLSARVSGSLTPSPSGSIGADTSATDFSGSFSFSVDLASGAISNGAMSGSSALFALGSGGAYNLSGGSGTLSGGSFSLNGFSGTATYAGTTMAIDPGSYMNGTGSVSNVGDTVSGTYYIDTTSLTGWNMDQGTFSGARTQ